MTETAKHLKQPPNEANRYHQAHVALLLNSFERLLHRPLLKADTDSELGRQAFFADFVLLSHDTQDDPVFNYANKTGLGLFELSWQDLIEMPSRLSAEPVNRQERERLLTKVGQNGYIDDYSGVRISKNGKRFLIRQAVVWNVIDSQGEYRGQAACFKDWIRL